MWCVLLIVSAACAVCSAIYPAQYSPLLGIGVDVQWLNTISGRNLIWHLREDKGHDVPEIFKEHGYNHVRIPVMEGDLHQLSPTTGVSLLEEMERLVDACIDADLCPVISFSATRFQRNPSSASEMDKVVHWWSTVASYLKGKHYRLSYNIYMGASEGTKPNYDTVNQLYQKVERVVHAVDPQRVLIIRPTQKTTLTELSGLVVPDSDYMLINWIVYEFPISDEGRDDGSIKSAGKPFSGPISLAWSSDSEDWDAYRGIDAQEL